MNEHLLTTHVHLMIPGIERKTVGSYLIARFTFVSDCVTVRVAVAVDCIAFFLSRKNRERTIKNCRFLLLIRKLIRKIPQTIVCL